MAGEQTTTSYAIGDPVCVSDAEGDYLGVVTGLGAELTVQMITKHADGLYHVTSECLLVEPASIVDHVHLRSDDDAPRAYDRLGYRMLDGGTFAKHTDEALQTMPIGDPAFEIYSDDEGEEEDDDMSDFIVPDEECEPFTTAQADNEFVRSTHCAVREFNNWVPKDDTERRARDFIIRQHARAVRVDDDARFSRNMPGAASYEHPS